MTIPTQDHIAWDQAPNGGKKEKEVVWGGERVAEPPPPFPPSQTTAGLASLADIFPIFIFCLFPQCGACFQAKGHKNI